MDQIRLVDRVVTSLRPEPGERIEIRCDKIPGLSLRASAKSKVWVYRFRRPDGTHPRLRLGHYVPPEYAMGDPKALTVSGARRAARLLMTEVDAGRDPATQRQLARLGMKNEALKTVTDLSVAYFEACESGEYRPSRKTKRPNTLKAERHKFKTYIQPEIGALRVEAVDRHVVKALLRDLTRTGRGTTANRVRSFMHAMFQWAVFEERLNVNPVSLVPKPFEETARERVLTDTELRRLWACLEDPQVFRKADGRAIEVGRPVRIAIALCLFTMQRRGEVAGIRLDELDLENALWRLPSGTRTKSGRAHAVPLNRTALSLIQEALALRPATRPGKADSPFLFPSPKTPSEPIGPSALSQAMRDIREGIGVEDITVHDLRRSTATRLAQNGVAPFDIALCLSHATQASGVAAVTFVYVRADFLPEKTRAMTALDRLLTGVLDADRPSAQTATGRPAPARLRFTAQAAGA